MSYFSNKFYKKERSVNRSLSIDEDLYIRLEDLSKNVYDASISKLVSASIERLIETENIQIYERKKRSYVSRSFLLRESLLDSLYELKDKYGVSLCLLINVAIRNALLEEEEKEMLG